MRSSGLARSMTGRAMRHGETKSVSAPVFCETAPEAHDHELILAPQPGPQSDFLVCDADLCFYGGGAGGGKLLDLDTPIPTPGGWSTMGTLQVGDAVFDDRGHVCHVEYLSPIVTDAVAYRLTFSDGTEVVACAEHLWHTYTSKDLSQMTKRADGIRMKRRETRTTRGRGGKRSERFSDLIAARNTARALAHVPAPITGAVRTTQQIVDTLRTPRGRTNHAIPVAGALQLPDVPLLLDPYLLGCWLGDGSSAGGQITTTDPEIIDAFRAAGFTVRQSTSYVITWGIHRLVKSLRAIGVLGNKHVPPVYLRASTAQRLALLQGLMDTDGTIGQGGGCDFDNMNRRLAEAVYELVASLGMQPSWTEKRATLRGKNCGTCYRVQFTPTMPVFRLPRKLARQRPTQRRTVRFRYIVGAERVPSVPMRCAQVSSPNHLFLCTRAMIPTHNTAAIVMEAARHHHVPEFTAVYFRRSYTEIFMPKGIWDEAKKVYTRLGWTPRVGDAEWVTPAGGRVVFAHLQHEDTVDNWKSAQIALICFDQLETFTEHQFFYMLSRNRSTCGVRPYIRATFNPEPGWLATLLQWWWDPTTGYPIKERAGVIRWMARMSGEIHWGDTRDELVARFGEHCEPLSVTFIPALLDDNKILQRLDPGYRAKLLAMPIVEQERLLRGNFKIRPQAGRVLPRAKFTVLTAMPTDIVRWVRGWDNAATKGAGDYTSAVKIGQRANGRFVILHRWRDQLATGERDEAMRNLARSDGYHVEIALAQEPGSAGKDVVYYAIQSLAGYQVAAYRDTGDKLVRARPFASQLAAGNIDVYMWDPVETEEYLQQIDAFPTKGVADDDVDATTKAFKHITMMPMGVMDGEEEDFSLV